MESEATNDDVCQLNHGTEERLTLTIDLNSSYTQMVGSNIDQAENDDTDHVQEGIHTDVSAMSEFDFKRQDDNAEERNLVEAEDGMEATNLVRKYHGVQKEAIGNAAVSLGVAGLKKDGQPVICDCCQRPESFGKTLICDGCEQSFHVGCLKLRVKHAVELDDWLCPACLTKGVQRKWFVGRIRTRRDVEEVETGGANVFTSDKDQSSRNGMRFSSGRSQEEVLKRLKRGPEIDCDIVPAKLLHSAGNSKGRSSSRSKSLSQLNVDDVTMEIGTAALEKRQFVDYGVHESPFKSVAKANNDGPHAVSTWQLERRSNRREVSEDRVHRDATGKREWPQTSSSFSTEGDEDDDTLLKNLDLKKLGKLHMQKLKEFITQKKGVLEEGWEVGVKKRSGGDKVLDITFYSPDRQKFRSRLDVARYLGLLGHKKTDNDSRELLSAVVRSKRRKEWARGQRYCYESGEEDESDTESLDMLRRLKTQVETNSSVQEPFLNLDFELPLQCMDLKVECLGSVDLRPGYCDENHIWPVGYCCSWHDSVTGSICTSEVLDGGPSGPIFRVTRRPCTVDLDKENANILQRCNKEENADQIQNNKPITNGNLECSHKHGSMHTDSCSSDHVSEGLIKFDCPNCTELNLSKQLYDEEYELKMLLGNLESFIPDAATLSDISGITGEQSFFGWENWGYPYHLSQNSDIDQIHEGAADMIGDMKYRSPEGASVDSVIDPSLKFRNSESGSVVQCPQNVKLEKQVDGEGNAAEREFLQSESTNAMQGKLFELGVEDISPLQNDQTVEIVVEATSPTEAWQALAKRIVEYFMESLRRSASFELGCSHSETSLSSASGMDPLENIAKGKFGDESSDFETTCRNLLEWVGQDRFGFDIPVVQKLIRARKAKLEAIRPPPPSGQPVVKNVEAELVGDLLQIWEFLCRFYEVLGQKDPPSLEDLEEGLCEHPQDGIGNNESYGKMGRLVQAEKNSGQLEDTSILSVKVSSSECKGTEKGTLKETKPVRVVSHAGTSAVLAAVHISLLKVLLTDLQEKVSAGVDLITEAKRLKKKDGEPAPTLKMQMGGLITLNEATWPEVARRYVISFTSLKISGESSELVVQEHRKLLQCIQGDGGVLCGALDGVAGIEADAQLLAEAVKQVWPTQPKSNLDPNENGNADKKTPDGLVAKENKRRPEWAEVLEPVRKLATNVGARIRNCVRDALERDPPEWAREILEWSISKDIYKGNASGPTKKAVLSILAEVNGEEQEFKMKKPKRPMFVVPTPALVMKRCRAILRQLITSDEWRVFCNLLSGTVLGYYENKDDGTEVAPAIVSRPLDFRIIDSRLAAGAYGESHESFLADMQQLWKNIPIVFHDREDMIRVGETLSQQFEILYQNRVIELIAGKEEVQDVEEASQRVSHGTLDEELMKAPWEEGVCKICGIDKDDDLVLLCDGCDAEYHIYCLNPPLLKIPDGNWYCPSCIALDKGLVNSVDEIILKSSVAKMNREECLCDLAKSLGERDYWQLSVKDRITLLKFLCDKVLDSAIIREHLEQCIEASADLSQKLRSLLLERQSFTGKVNNRTTDSLNGENAEVVSRELLAPKRRGRKSTRAPDLCVVLEENEMAGNAHEEMRKQHFGHQNYKAPEVLGIELNKKQANGIFEEETFVGCRYGNTGLDSNQKPFDSVSRCTVDKTTEDTLTDISFQLQQQIEPEAFLERNNLDTSLSLKARGEHKAARKVMEVREKTSMDLVHVDACKVDGGSLELGRQCEGDLKGVDPEMDNHKESDSLSVIENVPLQTDKAAEEQSQGLFKGMEAGDAKSNVFFEPAASSFTNLQVGVSHIGMHRDEKSSKYENQPLQIDQVIEYQVGQMPSSLQFNERVPEAQISLNINDAGLDDSAGPRQSIDDILEADIEKVEAEIMKTAVRRDRLGRDSLGRVYWALTWAGKAPWLVVEGINSLLQKDSQLERNNLTVFCDKAPGIPPNAVKQLNSEVGLENDPVKGKHQLMLGGSRQQNVQEWIAYESDAEFEELLGWLKPSSQSERSLKSAIIQWRMLSHRNWKENFSQENNHRQQTRVKSLGVIPGTKAAAILVKKFGPIFWSEGFNNHHVRKRGRIKVQSEDSMFRCNCLELVWTTRCHCPSCHETFDSSMEIESHNYGTCYSSVPDPNTQPNTSVLTTKAKKRKVDSYTKDKKYTGEDGLLSSKIQRVNGKWQTLLTSDVSLVAKKFTTPSTTRERILQIGFIADNGPTFAPALSFAPAFDPSLSLPYSIGYVDGNLLSDITNLGSEPLPCILEAKLNDFYSSRIDAGFHLARNRTSKGEIMVQNGALDAANVSLPGMAGISANKILQLHSSDVSKAPGSTVLGKKQSLPSGVSTFKNEENHPNSEDACSKPPQQEKKIVLTVPLTSMQPLSGRNLWILRRLKANLLDIEALLAPEAVEPSRGHPDWKRSWRSFVKSAGSIYGLVQAAIVLEWMLKADFLRDSWCNWSSLSTGAKTATLSSLALRIYSLDAAIKYKKAMITLELKDGKKVAKPGRKKKS